MNNLEIFKNEAFGEIRSVKIKEDIYFVGKDVALALGYSDTDKAIRNHVEKEDKLNRQFDGSGQNRNMTIINESGLYSLILSSKLPKAKEFKHWVTSEVLPSIRKTGEYKHESIKYDVQNKNAEARLKNVKVKEANFILDTLEKYNLSSISKELLVVNALEVVLGENTLPRPQLEEKYYTATDIANEIGVTANAVGKMSNKYNLKTDAYGIIVLDKAKHCNKQISTFKYNEKGRQKLTSLFKQGV